MIALPYGIEGFAFNRTMAKEDKSTPKLEETLQFRVIEFSKEAKKINLSHVRTWQTEKANDERFGNDEDKKKHKELNKINDSNEKATLGDLDALKSLRKDLDESNNA